MGHDELLPRGRGLLDQALQGRFEGRPHTDKVQAQAYADGYMRALADAGLMDQGRLLQAVGQQRRAFLAAPPVRKSRPAGSSAA